MIGIQLIKAAQMGLTILLEENESGDSAAILTDLLIGPMSLDTFITNELLEEWADAPEDARCTEAFLIGVMSERLRVVLDTDEDAVENLQALVEHHPRQQDAVMAAQDFLTEVTDVLLVAFGIEVPEGASALEALKELRTNMEQESPDQAAKLSDLIAQAEASQVA